MRPVNVFTCEPDEALERGEFRHVAFDLTERLGGRVIGATVYEMKAGEKRGPYHYHHGVEEWLYVISGEPMLREPDGARKLGPGELVAFPSGPAGAHTVDGPGRVVIFSAGTRGWGESFVTVYPDSDKIAAAPGVMFRRSEAIDAWRTEVAAESSGGRVVAVNPLELATGPSRGAVELGPALGTESWSASVYELAPGEATAPYHYEWCREEWALVPEGAPLTLHHADGQDVLRAGDLVCFPEGPEGAHRLHNTGEEAARLIVFSSPRGRPMSAVYPDEGTVVIRASDHEGFRFRLEDQIEDYCDGEPGADQAVR